MNIPDAPLQPGLARRMFRHPLAPACLGAVLLLHGLYVDVISADAFYTLPAGALSLIVGVGLSFFLWRRNQRNGFVHGNVLARAVGYLAMPVLFALCFWVVLSKSVPWAAAVLLGSPHAEAHEFTLEKRVARRSCDFRADAVERLNLFPGHLCVSEDYVRRHGHRVVLIRLVGDRTPLGFRITHFEHQGVIGPVRSEKLR